MNAFLKALRSKTVWGSIFAAGATVVAAPAITIPVVLKAIAIVVTTAGARDALDKAAQTIAGSTDSTAPVR